MKKIKNALVVNQDIVCGIFYYAIEYLDYLLKNNINIKLLFNSFFKGIHKPLILDKYNKNKLHPDLFKNIIFLENDIYFIENIIILDSTTFSRSKGIIYKKMFYNYGNDLQSREKPISKKNTKKTKFYSFGDKELNLKVDYHYPLCLNFEIFRDKKEFLPYENNIYSEKNKENMIKNFKNRYKKDFQSLWNVLDFRDNDNVWDRANRIIPECKFYGKEILYDKKPFLDSTVLRFERDWQEYNIWNFKSPDTNLSFADWFKKETRGE